MHHHALPEASGHVLGIIFVQAKFVGNLAVAQIEAHQRKTAVKRRHRRCSDQEGNPLPEGLVVAGEDRAGQVTELPMAIQTAKSLSEPLGVVAALFDNMWRVTVRAGHAIGPTEFPHDFGAFFIIQELNQAQYADSLSGYPQLPGIQEEPFFFG